jgi:hypothetical protein
LPIRESVQQRKFIHLLRSCNTTLLDLIEDTP